VYQRKRLVGLAEETSCIEAVCMTFKDKEKRQINLSSSELIMAEVKIFIFKKMLKCLSASCI